MNGAKVELSVAIEKGQVVLRGASDDGGTFTIIMPPDQAAQVAKTLQQVAIASGYKVCR